MAPAAGSLAGTPASAICIVPALADPRLQHRTWGGGCVHSLLSWLAVSGSDAYGASKAAL